MYSSVKKAWGGQAGIWGFLFMWCGPQTNLSVTGRHEVTRVWMGQGPVGTDIVSSSWRVGSEPTGQGPQTPGKQFSKSPRSGSIDITWELVRHANSCVPPGPTESEPLGGVGVEEEGLPGILMPQQV